MGQEVLKAATADPDLLLVGAVDQVAQGSSLRLPDGSTEVPLSTDLKSLIKASSPRVMVDFTQHSAVIPAARIAVPLQVSPVIGTSGLSSEDLHELNSLSQKHGMGIAVIPNFSMGAVLMTHFAKIAAKHFDYAEIIEMHHEKKIDAPSGTAMATARGMIESRGRGFIHPKTQKETLINARGGEFEGIAIHSVRSPGYLASQEVVFGEAGGALKIRHDQLNREGFMPGVMLAIKEVVKSKSLIFGLDKLLGL